ncbi:MAG: biopolymer transporter ExbD [Myxococcales bacterium]|jgi:biopolymer transport protein ExbD|nr:biopolymer transporter ExbD [Myxococcales bacterium]
MSKRRRHKEEEIKGELNIVPYLDILMNLIIFMLLSMTGLVTYGVLNVAAPSYGGSSSGASSGQSDKPKLLLTVLISEKGFFIAGAGAVLGAGEGGQAEQSEEDKAKPTVPRLPDGKYDFASLSAKIREIKAHFPEETKIILGADPLIRYELLIDTMDTCREYRGRELFSDVSLTVM